MRLTVSFKSCQVPTFRPHPDGFRLPVQPHDTWGKILETRCRSSFTWGDYYVKSVRGKYVAGLSDTVSDYTTKFKSLSRNRHYAVHVFKRQSDPAAEENESITTTRRSGRSSLNNGRRSGSTISVDRKSLTSMVDAEPIIVNGNLNVDGESSGPIIDPNSIRGGVGVGGMTTTMGLGLDATSQMSQSNKDGQDVGDLKIIRPDILNKFIKDLSNRDMHTVCSEIMNVKAKNEWIKLSRQMPFTCNMLQHLFF